MAKVRITTIALFPKGMKIEDVPGFIDKVIEGEDPEAILTIYKTTALTNGNQRIYAKVSKVFDAEDIDAGWSHRITNGFSDGGCEDVAWRVTEIDLENDHTESTTASFPIELFQHCLINRPDSIILQEIPQKPFGSDAFWKCFEDDVE